ncbi:MAG: hypothetical protein ACK4KV_02475 [Rhodocyclaceae bacterium]
MEAYLLPVAFAVGFFVLNAREQRRRVSLLAAHLQNYRIERLMENLTEGYSRALGETATARQNQIWALLANDEAALSGQFGRFAADMAKVPGELVRVSKLGIAVPFADRLFPGAMFDLRAALAIHARGLERIVHNAEALPPKQRAFTLSAEMLLMQHTCHWYCKSKAVASARLLARHKSSYQQVLAAVSPATRDAYLSLVGG